MTPFPWHCYSKKLAKRLDTLRNVGYFTQKDAAQRQMHYAEGVEGLAEDGNTVHLYWLVDPADGIIVDAKFQVFGQSALIAAADAACELLIGKNYDQARRISADLIDRQLRDHPDHPAFPESTHAHLNLVLSAIDAAVEMCLDLPLPTTYVSPVPSTDATQQGHPDFLSLSRPQKLTLIEEIFNEEIRPYIELDAGGIEILDLIDDKELLISYQGTCTSCFSAIGTTLATIQQIVHAKIHPHLTVVPNMDDLKFS